MCVLNLGRCCQMTICNGCNCILSLQQIGKDWPILTNSQIITPFVERQEIEATIMTILNLLFHEWEQHFKCR